MKSIRCFVYRSPHKRGAYLYLPAKDEYSLVPAGLMKVFGRPALVLDFELTPTRQLVAADAVQVLDKLQTQGYYLQMPLQEDRHE
jgi:uncharacterized protein YcgL (UPF0745 family)